MHTVAPIWRVAALVLPLASMVGCDWIPVRRRIDPALYPVPSRPSAALIRGHRDALPSSPPPPMAVPGPAEGGPTLLAGASDNGDLPPLPDLVPVDPREAIGPAASTPLLDAALVRAEAVQAVVFGDPTAPDFGPEPVHDDPVNAQGPQETARRMDLEPIDLPAIPAEAPAPDGPTGPDEAPIPIPPLEPEGPREGPPLVEAEVVDAPEIPDPLAPGMHWKVSLIHLLEGSDQGAVEPIEGPGDPVPEATGHAPGADVDDPDLWGTVMELLAEPGEGPDAPIGPAPAADERVALRVARVALCREILGFDRIVLLDPEALQAGRDVLIYCELEGVGYGIEDDGHVSRMSTTLELLDRHDDRLWSIVMPVEDRCSRPRRDYFVGYRLTLPGTLAPGPCRLRVAQRDRITGAQAMGEAAFTIVDPLQPPSPTR